MSPELICALVMLQNAVTERVHASPTLRLMMGPQVLSTLREIERLAREHDAIANSPD